MYTHAEGLSVDKQTLLALPRKRIIKLYSRPKINTLLIGLQLLKYILYAPLPMQVDLPLLIDVALLSVCGHYLSTVAGRLLFQLTRIRWLQPVFEFPVVRCACPGLCVNKNTSPQFLLYLRVVAPDAMFSIFLHLWE